VKGAGKGTAMDADVPPPQLGPPAVLLDWPLPGCGEASLTDLCGAGAVAELARVAGAGGSVALDLGGRELATPAGGQLQELRLLCGPLAGLRSVALRNGTLSLRPGQGLVFEPQAPLQLTLERVKLVRPAPLNMERRPPKGGQEGMLAFVGPHAEGRLAACRFELAPAGQVSLPVCALLPLCQGPSAAALQPFVALLPFPAPCCLSQPLVAFPFPSRGPLPRCLCCLLLGSPCCHSQPPRPPHLTVTKVCNMRTTEEASKVFRARVPGPYVDVKLVKGSAAVAPSAFALPFLFLILPLLLSPHKCSLFRTAGHAQQSVHLHGCLRW
jgi:hypothetical protein